MENENYKEIISKIDKIHQLYDIYSSYCDETMVEVDEEDEEELSQTLSLTDSEADVIEKELFWTIYKTAHMMKRWGLMSIFDNDKDRCHYEAEALRVKEILAEMVQYYHYIYDICECFRKSINILDNIIANAIKEAFLK